MKTANIPVYGNIEVYNVYKIFCCLFKNRLYTKMLKIDLFSIFVNTLTDVL